MRQLGEWLNINGEAIYSSLPWKYQNDTTNTNVWYTQNVSPSIVYALLLVYPQNDTKIELGAPQSTDTTKISLLGNQGAIQWLPGTGSTGIIIDISQLNRVTLSSKWAWVFKLENVV